MKLFTHVRTSPAFSPAGSGAPLARQGEAALENLDLGALETARPARGTLYRWLRDIAIGVALLVATPVAIEVLGFRQLPFVGFTAVERLQQTEQYRSLRVATDERITPLAAGEALARITLARDHDEFRVRFKDVATRQIEAIVKPEPSLFASIRKLGPYSDVDHTKLITTAARGVTAAEAAWLKQMASLPLWRDADLVARAPRVDVLAGRFVLPLPVKAAPWAMPLPGYAAMRKIALAGVARAAWHVSQQDWQAAEQALRSVVSLGFVMMDNSPTIIEALYGATIMHSARDGLAQLAAVRGDKALAQLAFRAPESQRRANQAPSVMTPEERERMLAVLTDPSVPHAVRMEHYYLAHYLQWESVGQVLFGMSDATRATLDLAAKQLARLTSEAAFLELQAQAFEEAPDVVDARGPGVWLMGAANAASAITGNPRIAACMAPISAWP